MIAPGAGEFVEPRLRRMAVRARPASTDRSVRRNSQISARKAERDERALHHRDRTARRAAAPPPRLAAPTAAEHQLQQRQRRREPQGGKPRFCDHCSVSVLCLPPAAVRAACNSRHAWRGSWSPGRVPSRSKRPSATTPLFSLNRSGTMPGETHRDGCGAVVADQEVDRHAVGRCWIDPSSTMPPIRTARSSGRRALRDVAGRIEIGDLFTQRRHGEQHRPEHRGDGAEQAGSGVGSWPSRLSASALRHVASARRIAASSTGQRRPCRAR